jgi:hypothetical protein
LRIEKIASRAFAALLYASMAMTEEVQISSAFPTARCDACDRYVLTYVDFEGASESRRCVHCDGAIGAGLRWIKASELEAQGYQFDAPAATGGGGCGSGCGTCSMRKH